MPPNKRTSVLPKFGARLVVKVDECECECDECECDVCMPTPGIWAYQQKRREMGGFSGTGAGAGAFTGAKRRERAERGGGDMLGGGPSR